MPIDIRVLLIDDDQVLSFDDEARGDRQRQIQPPLEQIKWRLNGRVSYGIDSLDGSADFWSDFSADRIPDIVLSDVNFEKDISTPLQNWGPSGQMNRIPTGLSHCKPFAAIARANSRALSIVIFTQDTSIWARLLEPPRTAASVFGLLAAHEIFELSGILGERLVNSTSHNYDSAWSWLNRHHQIGLRNAVNKAVESFREQIFRGLLAPRNGSERATFLIPYGDAGRLRKWCAAMAANPRPLGPQGTDPGLNIVLADGKTDRIYFASLFADVVDIEKRPLPPVCYQLTPEPGELWRLDNGCPLIGNLIDAISETTSRLDSAIKALQSLPLDAAKLKINLRDIRELDNESRGLAILFRAIEIVHRDWQNWLQFWETEMWNPATGDSAESTDDYGWAMPLKKWVARIVLEIDEYPKANDGERPDRNDILEKIENLIHAEKAEKRSLGAKRLLGIAKEVGLILEPRGENGPLVAVERRARDAILNRPTYVGGIVRTDSSLIKLVRDTLGFGKDRGPAKDNNDNALGQQLFDAFLTSHSTEKPNANTRAKEGRLFFEAFQRGEMPKWIRIRCEEYCSEVLDWSDRRTWPFSLSGQIDPVS